MVNTYLILPLTRLFKKIAFNQSINKCVIKNVTILSLTCYEVLKDSYQIHQYFQIQLAHNFRI